MSYRRAGLAFLMVSALVAGVFAPQALADSNARIVRLSYVDGDAQIDRRDGRGFEHAFLNMPLAPGTRVSTGKDGRAEIELEDGSTVRLTPGTLVETQSLDLRSSGGKNTLVALEEGTAYFNIRKLEDDSDFRVTTGRREFSLTRASHFRLVADRSQVVLAVFKGEVEVIGEGNRLTVRKDETLTLDLNDPARYYLAKGVPGDRYDDWDHERDQYRDRYASAGNYRGYSSAYSYGVSDLNYWGSYNNIPGYGYMWRPYYYGVDWNPYANGAWYFYPGSGWIWVSAYPWGWMPFRYGSWYYVGGHGWCWRPARHWNSWSPVVVVHNPPPGHRLPVAPPPTGRRDPVIVGRGPATVLPDQDPGPEHLIRNRNLLGRSGGTTVGGSGSGGVATPSPVSRGISSGGPGVSVISGGGSGAPAASGGSGQPAVDPGRRPAGRGREVDLEEAIRNARDHRSAGGQSGGVITNSGSGSADVQGASGGVQSSRTPIVGGSGSSSGVSTSGGSGVTSPPDSSPSSGRERIPESRRQLPPSITRDSPTPGSSSGSAGVPSSGWSGGSSSGSGSGASSPPAVPAPASGGGRSPEPRREVPQENFVQNSGPSGSGPSRSSSAGSGGGSSGSSVHSSPPPSSSGSSGRGSGASSGSSVGGGHSAGASSAGAGHSSSGGRSSGSSSPRSSDTSSPK